MIHPMQFTGTYKSNWAGYTFKEPLGYTSGLHTGVDVNYGSGSQDLGFAIKAITSGKVVARVNEGQVSGFGNALIIESDCPPGVAGTKLYHRYLHLSVVHVSVGQTGAEGQHIANCGGTGGVVPHLHIDTWTNRNGLGAHWNYDKNTSLSSYEDPYYLVENNKSWTSGGSSMATTTDDNSRQLGWHFLGRNGYDGKPNALNSRQDDLYGKELSPAFLSGLFLSPEGREWRDTRVPQLYGERDALRATNANLNTQITQLTKAAAELQATVEAQAKTIGELQMSITGKTAEIAELQDQVVALKAENEALKKQLLECGTTPSTPITDAVVITKDSVWDVFVNWLKSKGFIK